MVIQMLDNYLEKVATILVLLRNGLMVAVNGKAA